MEHFLNIRKNNTRTNINKMYIDICSNKNQFTLWMELGDFWSNFFKTKKIFPEINIYLKSGDKIIPYNVYFSSVLKEKRLFHNSFVLYFDDISKIQEIEKITYLWSVSLEKDTVYKALFEYKVKINTFQKEKKCTNWLDIFSNSSRSNNYEKILQIVYKEKDFEITSLQENLSYEDIIKDFIKIMKISDLSIHEPGSIFEYFYSKKQIIPKYN